MASIPDSAHTPAPGQACLRSGKLADESGRFVARASGTRYPGVTFRGVGKIAARRLPMSGRCLQNRIWVPGPHVQIPKQSTARRSRTSPRRPSPASRHGFVGERDGVFSCFRKEENVVATIEHLIGYLRPSQAAARIGVSEASLRSWAAAGRLPVLVTPNGRIYLESDIDLIARQRAERSAET